MIESHSATSSHDHSSRDKEPECDTTRGGKKMCISRDQKCWSRSSSGDFETRNSYHFLLLPLRFHGLFCRWSSLLLCILLTHYFLPLEFWFLVIHGSLMENEHERRGKRSDEIKSSRVMISWEVSWDDVHSCSHLLYLLIPCFCREKTRAISFLGIDFSPSGIEIYPNRVTRNKEVM
jgi:hypothetical protein